MEANNDKRCVLLEMPIQSCTINLTELLTGPNGPRQIWCTHQFPTVAHLGSYLSGEYGIARSLGYNLKRKPRNLRLNRLGRLSLEIHDRFRYYHFEFDDVDQFVTFLKDNPEVAAKVEYHSKL
jgi:hypothetical protein